MGMTTHFTWVFIPILEELFNHIEDIEKPLIRKKELFFLFLPMLSIYVVNLL